MPLLFDMMSAYDVEEEHAIILEAKETGVELSEITSDTVNSIAGRLLDFIAVTLPNKHVMPLVTHTAMEWVSDPNPKRRIAGIMAIGVCAEGCVDAYADFLPSLLELVGRLTSEDNVEVMESALWTLSQLCEFVQPVITEHYDTVMPIFMAALAHSSPYVLERACHGLECYLDGMMPHVLARYQEQLFVPLGEMLVRPDPSGILREVAVSALASAISSSDKRLTPMVPPLMASLFPLAELSDAKQLRLRACAIEAITYTAVVIGAEAFAPYLHHTMAILSDSLQFDHYELAEQTLLAYGAMAHALGEDFGPYVKELMPVLQGTMEASFRVVVEGGDEDGVEALADDMDAGAGEEDGEHAGAGGHGGSESGSATDDTGRQDEASREAEDLAPGVKQRVHTGEMEVRVAAARCISSIFQYAPIAAYPHSDDVDALFSTLTSFVVPEMEVVAAQVLGHVLLARLVHDPPTPPAEVGGLFLLSDDAQRYLNFTMTQMVLLMSSTHNRMTAGAACAVIRILCERLGLAAVQLHHLALMDKLVDVGRERSICQSLRDDGDGGAKPLSYDDDGNEAGVEEAADGEGDELGEKEEAAELLRRAMAGEAEESDGDDAGAEGERDHDMELIDEATDTVLAVLVAMGEDGCKVYLPRVLRAWARFTKPTRPPADRLMTIGLWGDLINKLPRVMEPHLPDIMPIIVRELSSTSVETRRNAVFTIGVLAARCTDFCRPFADSMLATMAPLLAMTRSRSADNHLLDNLASCIIRICTALPDRVPLDTLLPHAISLLPLQADMAENETVWGGLLDFLVAGNPAALACTSHVIAALGACIVNEWTLSDHVRTVVVGPRLRTWYATASQPVKDAMMASVAGVSEEGQAAIALLMRG